MGNYNGRFITAYIEEKLPELVVCAKSCGISAMYLFGSATTLYFDFWRSNVDIAIAGSAYSQKEFCKRAEKVLEYSIDFISLEELPLEEPIRQEIMAGVKLI